MGYPMTYQRVMSRNRLKDGGYDLVPRAWMTSEGASYVKEGLTNDQLISVVEFWKRHVTEDAQDLNRRFKALAGDLRRLEADAVDELGICEYITQRTGIEHDVVAAVLKEFMAF